MNTRKLNNTSLILASLISLAGDEVVPQNGATSLLII